MTCYKIKHAVKVVIKIKTTMDMKVLKKGDMVKTIYGDIEEVMRVEQSRVITYESARTLSWYHPTKVWLVNNN